MIDIHFCAEVLGASKHTLDSPITVNPCNASIFSFTQDLSCPYWRSWNRSSIFTTVTNKSRFIPCRVSLILINVDMEIIWYQSRACAGNEFRTRTTSPSHHFWLKLNRLFRVNKYHHIPRCLSASSSLLLCPPCWLSKQLLLYHLRRISRAVSALVVLLHPTLNRVTTAPSSTWRKTSLVNLGRLVPQPKVVPVSSLSVLLMSYLVLICC